MEDRPNTPKSEGFYSNKKIDPLLHKKYFLKYRTIKKIGEGSFGKVYKAEYNNEYFAIKFEDKESDQHLLETEVVMMNYLKGPYIPQIKAFGYNQNYFMLVMDLMGKNLEQLLIKTKDKKFSIKTTSLLAYQMISILKYIHNKHIIHRDIKPDNFVVGLNHQNGQLFLIDFGLAKKYRSSKTLEQFPYIKKKKLTGTARYASIHALEEMEQSRRDDLEAVGYVLFYFLNGNLPWMGMKIKSKEDRIKKILDKKKGTSIKELCKNLPYEFREFLEYTRNLEYTEEPKYDIFKNNFYNLITNKYQEKFDYIYDWTTENELKKRKKKYINNLNDNNDENHYEKEEESIKNIEIKINLNMKEVKGNDLTNSLSHIKVGSNIINTINIKENKKIMDNDDIINNKVDLKCCIMYVNNIFTFIYL